MRRQWDWRGMAFWTICGWCSWVMTVRGQESTSPRILFENSPSDVVNVPLPEVPTEASTAAKSPDVKVAASPQPPNVVPAAFLCDPATGVRLQGSPNWLWSPPVAVDLKTAYRCVQILQSSSIDSDRRRALATLEQCPWWPQVRGALTAVRAVAAADYSVDMRAAAMRMLTRGDLPPAAVRPTLILVSRFDGAPELRQTAQVLLAPTR